MSRVLRSHRFFRFPTTARLSPVPNTKVQRALFPLSAMAQHHSTSAPAPRKVRSLIPADSWDSHMHVTSPDYPLAAAAAYTPSAHTLEDAMAFEHSYNIPNIVLVQ